MPAKITRECRQDAGKRRGVKRQSRYQQRNQRCRDVVVLGAKTPRGVVTG